MSQLRLCAGTADNRLKLFPAHARTLKREIDTWNEVRISRVAKNVLRLCEVTVFRTEKETPKSWSVGKREEYSIVIVQNGASYQGILQRD